MKEKQRQSSGAEKKKKKKGREEEEGDGASGSSDHRRRRKYNPDLKPVMPSSHFPSNFVARYERRKKILSHEEPPPLSRPSPEENLQIKREKGTDDACVSCRCHHSITFRRRTAVTRLAISPVRTSPVFFKALSLIPQTTHNINSGLPRLIFNSAPQSKPAFFSQETDSISNRHHFSQDAGRIFSHKKPAPTSSNKKKKKKKSRMKIEEGRRRATSQSAERQRPSSQEETMPRTDTVETFSTFPLDFMLKYEEVE